MMSWWDRARRFAAAARRRAAEYPRRPRVAHTDQGDRRPPAVASADLARVLDHARLRRQGLGLDRGSVPPSFSEHVVGATAHLYRARGLITNEQNSVRGVGCFRGGDRDHRASRQPVQLLDASWASAWPQRPQPDSMTRCGLRGGPNIAHEVGDLRTEGGRHQQHRLGRHPARSHARTEAELTRDRHRSDAIARAISTAR